MSARTVHRLTGSPPVQADHAAFAGRPSPGRSRAPRASRSRPPAAAKTACRLWRGSQ